MPAVKDAATIAAYVQHHAMLVNALANLTEFVNSMPAPDENGNLPGVDYGYTGSTACMVEHLAEATRIADAMSK
jgi:hypothetical protein